MSEMLPDPTLVIISIFTIGSGIALFLSKRLLHAVLSLTFAFMGSALVFIYLGQSFIALLQLFVFVGGLSTYLVVAVAADQTKSNTETLKFVILLVAIALGLSAILGSNASLFNQTSSSHSFTEAAIPAFNTYYPILFMLALLLFGTVIGSIIIIRRFVRLVF